MHNEQSTVSDHLSCYRDASHERYDGSGHALSNVAGDHDRSDLLRAVLLAKRTIVGFRIRNPLCVLFVFCAYVDFSLCIANRAGAWLANALTPKDDGMAWINSITSHSRQ